MIDQIIAKRRAVFPVQYNQEAISREEIEMLLKAANWAPTHRRTEPWRFRIFHSDASRRSLAEFLGTIYKNTVENFSETKFRKTVEKPIQSSCVIAICMQRDPKESVPEWEEVAATAMAVQNMWLQATELQIGAYWSSPKYLEHFGDLVELNEGEKCIGLFYMGKYNGDLMEGTRKSSIDEKVHWM